MFLTLSPSLIPLTLLCTLPITLNIVCKVFVVVIIVTVVLYLFSCFCTFHTTTFAKNFGMEMLSGFQIYPIELN